MLGARYLGAKLAKGRYILMLDSDQPLKNSRVLRRSIKLMKRHDMLVLEESIYAPRTILEKLAAADRKLVHKLGKIQLDPVYGVLLPRFFKKSLLTAAFRKIDMKKLHDIVIFDHAIIYYEAYKISKRVGILNNAVMHSEPPGILAMMKHNYRYGVTSKRLSELNEYKSFISKKTRLRTGGFRSGNLSLAIQSSALLMLKGVAYCLGRMFG